MTVQALVVDDSAVIRKVARRIFEGLQFETAEAEDGAKGLDACKASMPDVIMVDWAMPGLDGFAFIRALRKLPDGRKPRVLLCTSERDVAQIARGIHAGADEFIMKPFDRSLLTAKLEKLEVVPSH